MILIVGAGPTGLSCGIELARRGVACRIIDKQPQPFQGSRGKGLQPRTLEVFHAMGVLDDVLANGGPYPALKFHCGALDLKVKAMGAPQTPTAETPYPNVWMLPQAQTEAALRKRLAALGVQVEFGTALQSIQQTGDKVVAHLSHGEAMTAAYLIGADGAHSSVRRAVGLRLEGPDVGSDRMCVADVEVPGLDRQHWHIWPLAKGGPMALCPLAGTVQFQFFAKAQRVEKDHIAQAVARAIGLDVGTVAWSSTYQPAARMVSQYRVGRVFLAGDAAHVHPPTGAQGLNTGVQDAYNLGWKLACAMQHPNDVLLDTYEQERMPVAKHVLALSSRLFSARSLRRGPATRQLGIRYRHSPLSSGSALGSLHPGDRMPDCVMQTGERLFDLLRQPEAISLETPGHQRLLIRPDGHIASIGHHSRNNYLGLPIATVQMANVLAI